MGGAQANGTAEDTVVVYTPSVLDHGIYMSNITLPHGRFWSDVIEDPGRQQLCWYIIYTIKTAHFPLLSLKKPGRRMASYLDICRDMNQHDTPCKLEP